MLSGTPYLLEGEAARAAMEEVRELEDNVSLLRMEGALDQKTLARLRAEWRVEQIYETVGIEGNQLDLNETRLVLARGITITGKGPRDSEEVLQMQQALDYLEELGTSSNPITALEVRRIHQLVLGDQRGAGRYRDIGVEISGSAHVPPSHLLISSAVDEALHWLTTTASPPTLAATVIHAWLVHIHPFLDGNGRTARAVMNLVLIRTGSPIVLIRRKDRERYYDALAASDDGDIALLLDLVLRRSQDSLRQIRRIRAAEAGITEAVERAQQQARMEYEVWRRAALLFVAEIERHSLKVREASSRTIEIKVREYDQVTEDDFLALLERDPSGNGWLAAIKGRGMTGRRSELLLWVGFRSQLWPPSPQATTRGASIFLSEPDPTRAKPFRPLADHSPISVREIAFDDEGYLVREHGRMGQRVVRRSAAELAAQVVSEFIEGYLTADGDRPVPACDG